MVKILKNKSLKTKKKEPGKIFEIVRYLGPQFERCETVGFPAQVSKMSSRSTRSSTRNRQSNRPIRAAHRRRYPEPRVVSFLPKERYKTRTTSSGLLILSKRKHVFLTAEEKEEAAAVKRQKVS